MDTHLRMYIVRSVTVDTAELLIPVVIYKDSVSAVSSPCISVFVFINQNIAFLQEKH